MTRIKRSQLAGTWYAGSGVQLRQQVDDLLHAAAIVPSSSLSGLVVPHAGYIYSGRAAAAGYGRLCRSDYQRAVILAPSHSGAFRGVAVLDADAFETPLGTVPVDRDGVQRLLSGRLYQSNPGPFNGEHSLEIQLPFLQRVLPGIEVVPALVGELGSDDLVLAAGTLRQLIDDRTLFIVSSDFVHYGWRFGYLPFPAAGTDQVRSELRSLDMGAIDLVCAGDVAGFRRYVADTGATICGAVPIALFLTMHQRRTAGELVEYYTSLDVTGDYEHCVSYASIVFPRST